MHNEQTACIDTISIYQVSLIKLVTKNERPFQAKSLIYDVYLSYLFLYQKY